MLPLSVGVPPAGRSAGGHLQVANWIGEVARTVPLVYQPTLLPGGTMTRPEGVLLPQPLYTVYDGSCLHLRV